jgi:transcription elongation factor GreB
MSKAFTKEDDSQADLHEELEDRPRGPAGRYITPQGYRRLQEELEHLWKVERPKITAEVAAAAALGDRSENAEYIYGKKKLREIDRRIRFLSKRLDSLVVVEPVLETDRVVFGCRVTVEDEDGNESTYRIVGPDELDVRNGAISVDSPLGRALLGKAVGDEVTVHRPKGTVDLVVVRIEAYAPSASRPSES